MRVLSQEDFDAVVAAVREKRERAFAYLATMAVLCLRGDAELYESGEEWTWPEDNKQSTHNIKVFTTKSVNYVECVPSEIAEALVLELAGFPPREEKCGTCGAGNHCPTHCAVCSSEPEK